MRPRDRITLGCALSALRKVGPLFDDPHRLDILSAADQFEQDPSHANIERARNAVHTAAHMHRPDSPLYAAGHAAAYAVAIYDAYVDLAQCLRDCLAQR